MLTRLIFFFFLFSIVSCTEKRITIGIQPYEKIEKYILDSMVVSLEKLYGCDVFILPDESIPDFAFTKIRFPRYRADSLLIHLDRIKPDTIDYLIGITNRDISTTKRNKSGEIKEPVSKYIDFGIFGLGHINGSVCVVSTYRLNHANRQLFIERMKKVTAHEIGHTMGLRHCPDKSCLMQDAAETIKTIDKATMHLCNACKDQL